MTSRREFLALAAAATFARRPAHASAPFPVHLRRTPPYQSMLALATPGGDEFPGEKIAMEIEVALHAALQAGSLPLLNSRVRREPVAADVSRTVFGNVGTPWLASLGEIDQARFFPLPEDTVRYEIKSRSNGKLEYRVGYGRVTWAEGKLEKLDLRREIVTTAGQPWFRDVTASLFEDCPSFREQLCRGVPYWRARLDPATGIDIYGSNGIAVADIDNDGWDEIYVCQPGGLPNRLYKNPGNGRLRDITEGSGLDLLDDTSCALFVDWRNSGRQDVVVLRGAGPLLFLNEGGNRFHLRPDAFRFATTPKGSFTGMAAADYDRDGKVDLYLCTYSFFQNEAQYRYPVPYHDAENGPANFLFRNALDRDGGGYFEDATAASGMNRNNTRFSFAPAWCDYNGDGWPDLYVANDFGRNNLYRNTEGHFEDVAKLAGVEDMGPGMSASWFDYDGDGRPDLYTSNMWSAAGARLVKDKNFAPAQGLEEAYRRHTKGNSLYRNRGDGSFIETGAAEGVEMGRWAWSSGGCDFDGDGAPEILTTCGMLSNVSGNPSRDDLMSFFWRQVVAHSPQSPKSAAAYENGWNAINQLIREDYSWNGYEPNVVYGRRGRRYYDFSGVSGLDTAEDGRAFAIADLDGDGRPDLLVKNRLGPQVRAFQNHLDANAYWIAFDLAGTKSNRDAIGARVEVAGQVQNVNAGSGYLSQHSKRLHFGLKAGTNAVRVRILWPSGDRQEFEALEAGYRYRITEGSKDLQRTAFAKRNPLPSAEVSGVDNTPRLHTTWFLEPVPLPENRPGPQLLTVTADFLAGKPDLAAWYSVFRRYLFDYRTPLILPLYLLIDDRSRACKIYADKPNDAQVRNDIAALRERRAPVFPGRHIAEPHRDYFKLGAAFYWAGYPDQALPYLAESLKRNPDNERVLLAVGKIHLQSGRPDEAKLYLDRATALNPANAEIWNELGGVATANNDLPGALALYKKAMSCDPHSPYGILNAAQTLAQLGRKPEAEALFRRALEIDPPSADAADGLGLLLAGEERYGEAKLLFQRAIEIQRDHASAINNLGVLYMKIGQVDDAIAALEYGVKLLPTSELLYMNLGRAYVQSRAPEKARDAMQRLLENSPENAAARKALRELEAAR